MGTASGLLIPFGNGPTAPFKGYHPPTENASLHDSSEAINAQV